MRAGHPGLAVYQAPEATTAPTSLLGAPIRYRIEATAGTQVLGRLQPSPPAWRLRARGRGIGGADATRRRHRPLPYPDPAPHAGRKSRAAGRRGGTCTQAPCPLPERPWSIAPDSPPVRPAIPGMATAPPTGSTSGIPSPGSRGPRGVAHFRPRRFPLRMAARPGSISKNPAAYGRVSCLTLRSPFDPWTTSASVCWPAYCCF